MPNSQVALVVKNTPANAGKVVQPLGPRKIPGKGSGTHFNTLAWEIPWTEEAVMYLPL